MYDGWIRCRRKRDHHRVRMICFHNAGGAANVFDSWCMHFNEDVEVCAVEMPGRWGRASEPRITDFDRAVENILPVIANYCNGATVFAGYSLGGLIAFEICRRLDLLGRDIPNKVFLISTVAPTSRRAAPIADLDQERLLATLRENTGRDIFGKLAKDMVKIFLPVLRDDLRIFESFQPTLGPPLPIDITLFHGNRDPAFVTEEAVDGWNAQTNTSFQSYEYEGDHFLLDEHAKPILSIMSKSVEGMV